MEKEILDMLKNQVKDIEGQILSNSEKLQELAKDEKVKEYIALLEKQTCLTNGTMEIDQQQIIADVVNEFANEKIKETND